MTTETSETAVSDIAAQLQETDPMPVRQIRRIIEAIGVEAAYAFLQQTLAIEAQGGMLTDDKQRRRTPGGVFFYLVRGQTPPALRYKLWPRPGKKQDTSKDTVPPKGSAPDRQDKHPSPFPWDRRETLARPVLQEKGAAATVKITLVGRPAKVIERADVTLITLSAPKPPPLPKGLPILPETAVTVYLVYIARKQWQKVAASIQDPEDRLVIEGYPFFDGKLNVIGVLTQNVTTVLQQRAKRAAPG